MTEMDSNEVEVAAAAKAVAGLLFVAIILSVTINPGLIRCYLRQKPSFQRDLFILVAVLDLLTTFVPAVIHAYNLTQNKEIEYNKAFICSVGCISQAVTVLLATTRLIMVLIPLHELKTRLAFGYLALYSVVMTTVNIVLGMENSGHVQIPEHVEIKIVNAGLLEFLCWGYTFLQTSVGILSSIGTVTYLFFMSDITGDNGSKKQGAITILLMNIPYLMNIFFTAGAFSFSKVFALGGRGVDFGDLQYAAVPILISGYNPVIIVLRKQSYGRQILKDARSCCDTSSNRVNTFDKSIKGTNDTIVTAM